MEKSTIFYDTEGKRLGSEVGILPVTLYKGMNVTIHGYEQLFEVLDWSYHHGHPDEEAGLKILLKAKALKTQSNPLIEWLEK